MGFSELVAPLLRKTLKLMGLAAPLSVLAIVMILVIQSYNEMANLKIGADIETASSIIEIEFGGLPQTTLLGR